MEEYVSVDEIRNFVFKRTMTHKQISEELQQRNLGVGGLSEMSIRRFCSKYNIHRTTQISDGELDCVVLKAVSQVSLKSENAGCLHWANVLWLFTVILQYYMTCSSMTCIV